MVGVTPQAVSQWESGVRPRLDTIRELDAKLGAGGQLAAAYGVTMDGGISPADAALEELRRRIAVLEQQVAGTRRRGDQGSRRGL